jgi:hypothetical protein
MDEHADDALVSGCEHLTDGLTLLDPSDRHVLAAAIHGDASVIVTTNLRDFPAYALATYEIEAQHPDTFVSGLLDEYQDDVVAAFHEMQSDLKNPPVSMPELLANLARQGLAQTVMELRRLTMPDQ